MNDLVLVDTFTDNSICVHDRLVSTCLRRTLDAFIMNADY